jgi:hypothetical protein
MDLPGCRACGLQNRLRCESNVNTANAQSLLMQHAAVNVGQPFTIPSDPRLADPEKMDMYISRIGK